MLEFLSEPTTQAVLSVLALLAICWGAYIGVVKLRDSSMKDQPWTAEAVKNLEEMRREGDISDAEYRKIKAVLGTKQASNADNAEQAS